ncbi:MAG: acetyl-CoA carboxylase, biotin carboxyl carrier protein [Pseudomonadota bacterium]|nr:acetyl-CoA carboxylase, biotin carboxyl carrier protein [Pseudomonadota bacterium]
MPNPKAPADLFDARLVRELAAILSEAGLSEIEVEREGLKVRVVRTLAPATPLHAQAPATALPAPPAVTTAAGPAAEPPRVGDVVKSPMVGTVYLQAQPGSPPFANLGDQVAEGQTLLLVEAMKTMNPIVAPRAGKILEFLVADAQPVEYGEPLVVIG